MKSWNERTREVAYLLNPAFCARLLYAAIKEYEHKTQHAFPFPLVYLILPLVLHKQTRTLINSRTQLLQWIQANQHLLIGFARRTKELVVITNEALELLLQSGLIQITKSGELSIAKTQSDFLPRQKRYCRRRRSHPPRSIRYVIPSPCPKSHNRIPIR